MSGRAKRRPPAGRPAAPRPAEAKVPPVAEAEDPPKEVDRDLASLLDAPGANDDAGGTTLPDMLGELDALERELRPARRTSALGRRSPPR